jgi:hypothetical protein
MVPHSSPARKLMCARPSALSFVRLKVAIFNVTPVSEIVRVISVAGRRAAIAQILKPESEWGKSILNAQRPDRSHQS